MGGTSKVYSLLCPRKSARTMQDRDEEERHGTIYGYYDERNLGNEARRRPWYRRGKRSGPKKVKNVERSLDARKTYHVPDERSVYHMNGVHGGAKTLHIKVDSATDGVAYVATHNRNIRVELLFPFLKRLC